MMRILLDQACGASIICLGVAPVLLKYLKVGAFCFKSVPYWRQKRGFSARWIELALPLSFSLGLDRCQAHIGGGGCRKA